MLTRDTSLVAITARRLRSYMKQAISESQNYMKYDDGDKVSWERSQALQACASKNYQHTTVLTAKMIPSNVACLLM